MTQIAALLDSPGILRLSVALLHFLWQGTVVAVLGALSLLVLRRSTAAVRYLTLLALFAATAACPITTFVLSVDGPVPSEIARRPGPEGGGTTDLEWYPLSSGDPAVEGIPDRGRVPTLGDQGLGARDGPAAALWQSFEPHLGWVAAVWAAGVLVLSLRLLLAWTGLALERRRGTPLDGHRWRDLVISLSERLRVSRPVRLVESARAGVPMAIGWLRPVILLPSSAITGLTPEQLEAIIAHELAHIRRADCLVNLMQTVVEILLFYHPTVWWLSRRIREEREHCCDDLVVAVCGDAVGYARALSELQRMRTAAPQPGVAASGGGLLGRVRRLLGADQRRPFRRPRLVGVLVLVTLIVVVIGVVSSLHAPEASVEKDNAVLLAAAQEEIREQMEMLASPRAEERVAAAYELSRMEELAAPAAADLVALLGDESEVAKGPRRGRTTTVGDEAAWALNMIDRHAVLPLVKALGHEDPAVRRRAADVLADIRIASAWAPAFDALVEALKDEDVRVRRAAAGAFYSAADPRAVGPLTAALDDEDRQVRSRAARALGAICAYRGAEVPVEEFIEALDDPQAAGSAVEALGAVGDARGVGALIHVLRGRVPADLDLRAEAAAALGSIQDPIAIDPLIEAMRSDSADVRQAALTALGRFYSIPQGPVMGLLKDEDPAVRRFAAMALRPRQDESALEATLCALEDPDPEVRKWAASRLIGVDDPRAVSVLLAALTDEHAAVRATAAMNLGYQAREGTLTDPRAVASLLVALNDADPSVREQSAISLGFLADRRAVEPLRSLLRDDSQRVCKEAARALGRVGGSEAVDCLLDLAADADSSLRGPAFEGLGLAQDPRATDVLMTYLQDEDREVRADAAIGLGNTNDKRSVGALVRALEDRESSVRAQAALALSAIAEHDTPELTGPLRGAVPPLLSCLDDPHPGVRAGSARALGTIGDGRATMPVIALLGDESWRARVSATLALGKLRDSRAVEPLLASMPDANRNLQIHVVRSLREIGGPEAVRALAAVLQNGGWALRRLAAYYLGLTGEPSAADPLLSALDDPHGGVRDAAAHALRELMGEDIAVE